MHKTTIIAALAAAAVLPLTASAYSHGKPGLWQATVQMKFAKGGPPPMPAIPPEALAMMKQMGREPPPNMNGPITNKFCLTPAQAAADKPPTPPQRGNCQMQNLQHSGSTFSADMICTGEMQGTGHMTVTYDSDDHYSGSMHFAGTSGHMGEVDMTNEFSGQWLGADCGSVQPMPMR
ncbi:MAG: DUF3617 domain-containing protein [Nevskia sp.]|nr:DUF3617 domain-containing protein [Nevskia sp.]